MEPVDRHFKGDVLTDVTVVVISRSDRVCRLACSGAGKLSGYLFEILLLSFRRMTDCFPLLLAHTTCASAIDAERLARALVEAHLAACVSIGSECRSVYPWQGRIESETEVPLLIKTHPDRITALKQFVAEHHGYEVPELLVTPVLDGLEPYLRWAHEWMEV